MSLTLPSRDELVKAEPTVRITASPLKVLPDPVYGTAQDARGDDPNITVRTSNNPFISMRNTNLSYSRFSPAGSPKHSSFNLFQNQQEPNGA